MVGFEDLVCTNYGHTQPKIAPRSAISDIQGHLLDLRTWRNLMVDATIVNLIWVVLSTRDPYFDGSARDLRI